MIIDCRQLDSYTIADFDVCIVGAGPVGLAAAMACAARGLTALVLDSGQRHVDGFAQALTAGHAADPQRHAPPSIAMCRGLGGTSRWWGGRCVPFDAIDFAERPHVAARWPLPFDEISRYHAETAAFFGIGSDTFQRGAWKAAGDLLFEDLERWTPQTDLAVLHRHALEQSSAIVVALGATVVALNFTADGTALESLRLAAPDGTRIIAPRRVVLACGGLEGTRLLLAAARDRADRFGGEGGPLGRYYMGHLSGKIADLVLADPAAVAEHDFFIDGGAFARRRLTLSPQAQLRERLVNIAFWVDNPPFYRTDHRSGILSLVWLALAIAPIGRRLLSEGVRRSHVGPPPRRWLAHLRNVLADPVSTIGRALAILQARFLSKPRKPGFLVVSAAGRYPLHYHGEQSPDPQSRVRLAPRSDALGLPFLDVDLRYARADAEAIVRAHEVLDHALRAQALGRLEFYDADRTQRIDRVMAQASDGLHQIGTTRMAEAPGEGVVDANCRVHGLDNLFVASSSVFPSSGQANPTFLAAALAVRLADHLRAIARPKRPAPSRELAEAMP